MVLKVAGSRRLDEVTLRNEECALRWVQVAGKCAFSSNGEEGRERRDPYAKRGVWDVGSDDEGRSRRGVMGEGCTSASSSSTNNSQLELAVISTIM